MQKIIFTIPQKGNPTLKVEGVQGSSCKDLTAALERALGNVVSDNPTEDMYARPQLDRVTQY